MLNRFPKPSIRVVCMLHFIVFALPFVAIAQPANSAAELTLDATIARLKHEAQIPGLSLAIIKNGVIQDNRSYGIADKQTGAKVTAQTVFEAASLSKPIIAYLTLILAERGQMQLDKPLTEYLPYPRLGDSPHAKQLTARIVLSHRTGLPNWGNEPLPFNFEPGSDFGYSGEGYVFLQKVLEGITKTDLDTLAKKEIFEPLKMHNSRFTWTPQQQFALAKGHDRGGRSVVRGIPEANGASSLHTTAFDYALFMQGWLKKLKNKDSAFQLASVPAIIMEGDERGAAMNTLTQKVGWGLGWGTQGVSKHTILWHWGDNGEFRAFAALDPQSQQGFVFLSNSQNGLAIVNALAKCIFVDLQPTVTWLNYETIDLPGWQQMLAGYQAESRQDYAQATRHFTQAFELYPGNTSIKQRVAWLKDMSMSKGIGLTAQQRSLIPGRYGPRLISQDANGLVYQRDNGPKRALTQIKPNIFAVNSVFGFRLEVVFDNDGQPSKLIGHYLGGGKDESPRSSSLAPNIVR